MEIKKATFIKSSPTLSDCPVPNKPEYAFIGRSNVGKSSLINMLSNRKSLAKTSGTPGKTQHINHFQIDDSWYLVDLPGYGWAQVSKTIKDAWNKNLRHYLLNRENLVNVFILVDIRHDPQKIDLEFMRWVGENGLPFSIIFTKKDKLKHGQAEKKIAHYKEIMLTDWEEMPPYFITSSEKKEGKEAILGYVDDLNKEF